MFSSVAVQQQHPVNTEANKYWNILVASFLYFSLSRQRRMERYQPASELNFRARADQHLYRCAESFDAGLKTDVIGYMLVWSRGPETEETCVSSYWRYIQWWYS